MINREIKKINDTVFCKLAPSKIHGIGVFAIRDIPKGTLLTDYTVWDTGKRNMHRVSVDEFKELLPEIQELILDRMIYDADTEKLHFISPNHDQIFQSFMNHSKEANSDGEFALRDIKKGEEITEDFTKLAEVPHQITKNHCPEIWE